RPVMILLSGSSRSSGFDSSEWSAFPRTQPRCSCSGTGHPTAPGGLDIVRARFFSSGDVMSDLASDSADPVTQPDAYIASLLQALGSTDPMEVLAETPRTLRAAVADLTRQQDAI